MTTEIFIVTFLIGMNVNAHALLRTSFKCTFANSSFLKMQESKVNIGGTFFTSQLIYLLLAREVILVFPFPFEKISKQTSMTRTDRTECLLLVFGVKIKTASEAI